MSAGRPSTGNVTEWEECAIINRISVNLARNLFRHETVNRKNAVASSLRSPMLGKS
jgi:hypothetical protein